MTGRQLRASLAATLIAALAVSACAPLSALDDILVPSGQSALLDGEVRSVDTRRGRLEVRPVNGRSQTLRYDGRTRVVNGTRQYPVSSLTRGDMVRVRVTYDRSGTAWADRIDLRYNTADQRRGSDRTERLDGRVGAVDTRRGHFTVEHGIFSRTLVYVPRRISSGDARRFDRLRRGDRVRVEVRPVGRGQAELVRFR
jgi:hypothetical protein